MMNAKMSRAARQKARGYMPPPKGERGEVHESRFRPLRVRPEDWRRRHANAINRHHPAALA